MNRNDKDTNLHILQNQALITFHILKNVKELLLKVNMVNYNNLTWNYTQNKIVVNNRR
jgi:hypothetical protein